MGKGSNLKDELEDSSSKKIKSTSSNSSLQNGTNDDKTNGKDPLKTFYTWAEVKMHNTKTDSWVVVNDNVYNLTNFKNKHPGGSRIINHFAGQDASEAFNAFHKEFDRVNKYTKLYHIGRIDPKDSIFNLTERSSKSENMSSLSQNDKTELDKMIKEVEIRKDFNNVRKVAQEMNLFNPSYTFFMFNALQILFFQIVGYYILFNYGNSFLPTLCSMFLLVLAQGQSSWIQHDFGHSSLFSKNKFNQFTQMLFIGLIKGASGEWWRFMHNQHHAKPNVIGKDPDVNIDPVFLLGDIQPIRKAEKNAKGKEKYLYSYSKQHFLFPFAAPILFPIFFQFTTVRYAIRRKNYLELATIATMMIIYFAVALPGFNYNLSKTFAFYLTVRFIESAWFAWVSQCNHIVMEIHDDVDYDSWLHLQLKATCNLEKSAFNDWFTGHLNFQIEHHLFPTMPRHNLYKVQPLIQSLCKKHNIRYTIKPMGRAFLDILLSLKKSGSLWQEAYDELIKEKHL